MKFWVSKRKILYKQFKINSNNKQHFSGSCSESKNASSVGRERAQVENCSVPGVYRHYHIYNQKRLWG